MHGYFLLQNVEQLRVHAGRLIKKVKTKAIYFCLN